MAAKRQLADALLRRWAGTGAAEELLLAPLASLDDAMEVQGAMLDSPLAAPLGPHGGWKLGWKGALPEKHALYGPLFSSGFVSSGDEVSLDARAIHGAEAEFAVVLGQTLALRDHEYTEAEVWDAVSHVELCIELPGARQYKSTEALHYVADALLSNVVVRGPALEKPSDPGKLSDVQVELRFGGDTVSLGCGKENPGDSPVAALTFLANELVASGRSLDADQLVICGHCCMAAFAGRPWPPPLANGLAPQVVIGSGGVLQADFDGLGEVGAVILP